jgi:hypothetical protein
MLQLAMAKCNKCNLSLQCNPFSFSSLRLHIRFIFIFLSSVLAESCLLRFSFHCDHRLLVTLLITRCGVTSDFKEPRLHLVPLRSLCSAMPDDVTNGGHRCCTHHRRVWRRPPMNGRSCRSLMNRSSADWESSSCLALGDCIRHRRHSAAAVRVWPGGVAEHPASLEEVLRRSFLSGG